eukprot:XP_019863249.1 PREDICTED: DNA-3-methyladenine glycosylase 1-like [Amphimedon queenslandica]
MDGRDAADLQPRPRRYPARHRPRRTPRLHALPQKRIDAGTARVARRGRAPATMAQRRRLVSVAGLRRTRKMAMSPREGTIIERLVKIRGIGQWTVEMLLIFNLDRADILPATDLGVRRGFMLCRKNESMPEPQESLEEGERRRPWRSVAAWYLWRACEEPEKWR